MATTPNDETKSTLGLFQLLDSNGSMTQNTSTWFLDHRNDTEKDPPYVNLSVYTSISRFHVETTVAVIAAAINLLTAVAVLVADCSKRADRRRADHSTRSVARSSRSYELLFVNMTVANVFSSVFSWVSNNAWKLFGNVLQSPEELCQSAYVWMSFAGYVSTSFIFVGTLTMLGFSVIQYRAIGCVGYRNTALPATSSRRCGREIVCIVGVWMTSMLAGLVIPFAVLLSVAHRQRPGCDVESLYKVLIHTTNVHTALLVAVYLTITSLCCLIYRHICLVRREINRFRSGDGRNRNTRVSSRATQSLPDDGDVRTERRAFGTLGLLIGSMAVFFVPYLTFHNVSLNVASVRAWAEQPGNESIIYYMSLLPYIRFAIDPIVYGLRMRGTHDGFRILFGLVTSAAGKRGMLSSAQTELESLSKETNSTIRQPTFL